MPTPEEIVAATTLSDRLFDLAKYILGGGIVAGTWIWKASKDHSRIAKLEDSQIEMESTIEAIEAKQATFITVPQHEIMQRQCQEHIARVQAEKLHQAIMDMKNDNATIREDVAILNANVCRLLGRFDVEPVASKDVGRRRLSDRQA